MLSFFNKYPYTNFEQLNLDWMMNMIGSFDARITKNTEDIHALDIRVTVAESDIDDLQERMITAESDIDDLQERMNTAEGDIDDLQDRMTTAEGKIENLETVVGDNSGGLVKDVDDLQNVVGDEHGGLVKDVDDLMDVVGDDDSGLVKDVNDLESSVSGIPIVTANPTGTPTGSLVTLGIDDDIYTISGGGGGSGTEVIANPSGTAAADLETVSIAGIIYDIPTTDITALTARVSDLETTVGDSTSGLVKDVDDLETVVGDSSSGLVKDVDDLETVVGDSSSGLVKDVDDLETVVGDSTSGLVKDVSDHETRITNLETVVGDSTSGLVKDVNDIKDQLSHDIHRDPRSGTIYIGGSDTFAGNTNYTITSNDTLDDGIYIVNYCLRLTDFIIQSGTTPELKFHIMATVGGQTNASIVNTQVVDTAKFTELNFNQSQIIKVDRSGSVYSTGKLYLYWDGFYAENPAFTMKGSCYFEYFKLSA